MCLWGLCKSSGEVAWKRLCSAVYSEGLKPTPRYENSSSRTFSDQFGAPILPGFCCCRFSLSVVSHFGSEQ